MSLEMKSKAQYWWFGVNNTNKRNASSKQHVIYPEIKSLLNGYVKEFEWPFHSKSRKFYKKMRQGDKVILWMGDGYFKDWGILGFCIISHVKHNPSAEEQNKFFLQVENVPTQPITPYISKKPEETEIVKFLRENFSLQFKPLGKTFNNVGYGTTRPIITIDAIGQTQYENVLQYSKNKMASNSIYPEEIMEPEQYSEGATKTISVNIYERNSHARSKCLEHFGFCCLVCGLSFEEKYGEIGKEFIHVHHLKQLSDIGKEYQLDLINDLKPVCLNCHAMIHKRKPPFRIKELRNILENQLTKG